MTRTMLVAVLVSIGAISVPGWSGPRRAARYGIVAFDLNGLVPQKLVQLGVDLVGGCPWEQLEPARGVYGWDCSDNVIVGAQKLGLHSAMTVNCTPRWDNGGAGCDAMPSDITGWHDFVANYVTRYSRFDNALGV